MKTEIHKNPTRLDDILKISIDEEDNIGEIQVFYGDKYFSFKI